MVEAEDQLAQVEIGNIPDREGQYLRNLLIDRFYRQGRPADAQYVLQVSDLSESKTELDITKTADATRAQLRISLQMRLIDKAQQTVVLERPLHAITSYNILPSEFATRVTEQNARESALNELARQIEQRLSLYFTK
ncbi:MAG: LPS assembly lipoprotein LptE [Alphaproteobacteria bacterium]|nr:LPS assembly lipoprotein LptE [Alphaproteobacteria bacterium]